MAVGAFGVRVLAAGLSMVQPDKAIAVRPVNAIRAWRISYIPQGRWVCYNGGATWELTHERMVAMGDESPQPVTFGSTAISSDLFELLGSPWVSIPFGESFQRDAGGLTWHLWLCSTEAKTDPALKSLADSLSALREPAPTSVSLDQLGLLVENEVRRGTVCSAVHDSASNVWYSLDCCRRHRAVTPGPDPRVGPTNP